MEKVLNKKVLSVGLFTLLSVFILSSCKPNDAELQKQVEAVLKTTYPTVSVSVDQGVATLTGSVDAEDIKMGAEAMAKTVKNIKSLNNNITVKTPVPPVIVNPDNEISQLITNALKIGGYDQVKVAVMNGEVTLTGEVKRDDLQKVMQIANESKPKKVINQLTVK